MTENCTICGTVLNFSKKLTMRWKDTKLSEKIGGVCHGCISHYRPDLKKLDDARIDLKVGMSVYFIRDYDHFSEGKYPFKKNEIYKITSLSSRFITIKAFGNKINLNKSGLEDIFLILP